MRRTGFVIVAFASLVVAVLARQQTPTFRAGIDVIQLDVSVLDKDRKPVTGLKVEDFTILEDGKPHPIVAFSEVTLPDTVRTTTAAAAHGWVHDVAPDVQTNELPNGRLLVIVMDDALVFFDPATVENGKKIAQGVVDRLGPNDLAAIVFTRDNRNTVDFTRDRAKLLAAIDKFSSGFWLAGKVGAGGGGATEGSRAPGELDEHGPWQPVASDFMYARMSVGVLQEATDFLIAIPDRRKALIWISSGVPVDPGDPKATRDPISAEAITAQMKQLLEHAMRANVNVYAVDPAGLNGAEFFLQNRYNGGRESAAIHHEATRYLDFLQVVADNTGGKAIINTNDFNPGLDQIFRETNSYYFVGYKADRVLDDGRYHRLEIKVDRPDVTVESRRGYWAVPPDNNAVAAKNASPLTNAVSDLLPKSDVSLRIAAAPFALAGGKTSAVAITLGVQRPGGRGAARADDVDVNVGAYTPEGKLIASAKQTVHVTTPPGLDDIVRYDVLSRIDLPPGRYELRLGATSVAVGKTGSVYTEVVVPDLAKDPLALSGVVLSATPGVAAAPKDAFEALLPIIPTSQREFYRSDRVTAFLRVYQGGKATLAPVALKLSILDEQNATVFDAPQALTADQFKTDRASDARVDLPLTKLARGEYLLMIEATIGKATTQRSIRFSIK